MKRIIDKRKKEKFMIDDKYLNGHARICGWQATLVYVSLCRHSNIDQESFPSIKLMMEELAVGRNTIIKGIKNLEKYNVIEVGKTRNKNGKWLNNSYTLLDKSDWIKNQVPNKDTEKKTIQVPLRDTVPSPSQNKTKSLSEQNQVPLRDTKETHRRKHIEGNTSNLQPGGCSPKKVPSSLAEGSIKKPKLDHQEIVDYINLFEGINPTISYGNKTTRSAVELLYRKFGKEEAISIAKYAVSIFGKKFAPVISTPYQLKEKISSLASYKMSNTRKVVTKV